MAVYFLFLTLLIAAAHFCAGSPFPSPSPPSPDPPVPVGGLSTPPASELTFGQEWGLWKLQNEKRYATDEEESYRRDVWLINKMFIEEHNANNAEEAGYTLAMNSFGDLTYSEWRDSYLSNFKPCNVSEGENIMKRLSSKSGLPPYPKSMDWRNKNAVSPVKNQDKCEGSYAFSAVAALEGAASLAQDKLITLSEQNIIDCSVPYGNYGCNGGTVKKAFQYVISAGGLDTEKSYPFSAKQGTCHYRKKESGTAMSGMVALPSGNEKELLAAVATVGPVSIAIDGGNNAFRFYSSGVFNTVHCSTTKLNHAMVITGYGETKDGLKYWLVKNSWGVSWGEAGYILMARDKFNQCGIATNALYPTL